MLWIGLTSCEIKKLELGQKESAGNTGRSSARGQNSRAIYHNLKSARFTAAEKGDRSAHVLWGQGVENEVIRENAVT